MPHPLGTSRVNGLPSFIPYGAGNRPGLQGIGAASLAGSSALNVLSPTFTRASSAYDPYNRTTPGNNVRRTRPINVAGQVYAADLIEGARTNVCLQSQTFDNATWVKTDAPVTADNTAAPDGTTTADLVTEGVAGTALITQTAMVIAATNQCAFSCFIKPSTLTWIRIQVLDTATGLDGFRAWFNLATGAIGTTQLVGAGTINATNCNITVAGNGFYRVALVGTSNVATIALSVTINSASADASATRVNNSTYWLWGAQLEAIAGFASSYIVTVAASASRAAELLTSSLASLTDPRTNLLTFSEQFDNAAWTKTAATITTGQTDSNGNPYARKLVEDSTNAQHRINQTPVPNNTVAQPYTWSVDVKAAGRNFVAVNVGNLGSGLSYANLSTGAFVSIGAALTSSSITNLGNGWFRVAVSWICGNVGEFCDILISTDGVTNSYLGDGASGILLGRAQLEKSATLGAYLPTAGTAVTAAQTGLSTTNGTSLVVTIPYGHADSAGSYMALYEYNAGQTGYIWENQVPGNVCTRNKDSAGSNMDANGAISTPANNSLSVWAKVYDPASVRAYNAGSLIATAAALLLPYQRATSAYVGSDNVGGGSFFGWVLALYWPRALTASELASISTQTTAP